LYHCLKARCYRIRRMEWSVRPFGVHIGFRLDRSLIKVYQLHIMASFINLCVLLCLIGKKFGSWKFVNYWHAWNFIWWKTTSWSWILLRWSHRVVCWTSWSYHTTLRCKQARYFGWVSGSHRIHEGTSDNHNRPIKRAHGCVTTYWGWSILNIRCAFWCAFWCSVWHINIIKLKIIHWVMKIS